MSHTLIRIFKILMLENFIRFKLDKILIQDNTIKYILYGRDMTGIDNFHTHEKEKRRDFRHVTNTSRTYVCVCTPVCVLVCVWGVCGV